MAKRNNRWRGGRGDSWEPEREGVRRPFKVSDLKRVADPLSLTTDTLTFWSSWSDQEPMGRALVLQLVCNPGVALCHSAGGKIDLWGVLIHPVGRYDESGIMVVDTVIRTVFVSVEGVAFDFIGEGHNPTLAEGFGRFGFGPYHPPLRVQFQTALDESGGPCYQLAIFPPVMSPFQKKEGK